MLKNKMHGRLEKKIKMGYNHRVGGAAVCVYVQEVVERSSRKRQLGLAGFQNGLRCLLGMG